MEKLQLFLFLSLAKLSQGFNALWQDICTLIKEFLTDLPAEIVKFLDLDGLKAGFKSKMGCEV